MDPDILGAEPMHIAIRELNPHTFPEYSYLRKGKSIPCLHRCCFLVDRSQDRVDRNSEIQSGAASSLWSDGGTFYWKSLPMSADLMSLYYITQICETDTRWTFMILIRWNNATLKSSCSSTLGYTLSWTVCVPQPQFMCWRCNPECGCIWRWDL